MQVVDICGLVESSCLVAHNIAPHISSHDLFYHETMKKYENSQSTPWTEVVG